MGRAHAGKGPAVYILASQRRGFASRYGVARLVHLELFGDMEHAIEREKQLKRWHRDWKINLIEAANPTWRDLAVDYGFEPLNPRQPSRVDAGTSSA
jgi:putative endonuclease